MSLRLVQLTDADGRRRLAAYDDIADARLVDGHDSVYGLAMFAIGSGQGLAQVVQSSLGDTVDIVAADAEGRLLAPIDHPDPAHLYVTGTGLTHLGSAEGRDQMHRAAKTGATTDSMRMFLMGVEGGKPPLGSAGVQPEWFYKGDGSILVGTGQPLPSPAFALDGGEEPEIAGIYVIDGAGQPRRLGFALGNEFSDHVTERGNYLWLAHSKLRHAALGAELLSGELPQDVRGTSSITRGGEVIWERPFLSGEANMSHAIANLEHHHFKYGIFRRPGDVHVHFFGTATLSFSEGIQPQEGDIFDVRAAPFQLPLRNPVRQETEPDTMIVVTAL
ncbi:AraD1 family protein [Glacieibacterium sp.]|uniref:AraD1 family protein n=1 Tax=Glacieibacterium sp. TaxID=2860237 RepID=UPI003B003116